MRQPRDVYEYGDEVSAGWPTRPSRRVHRNRVHRDRLASRHSRSDQHGVVRRNPRKESPPLLLHELGAHRFRDASVAFLASSTTCNHRTFRRNRMATPQAFAEAIAASTPRGGPAPSRLRFTHDPAGGVRVLGPPTPVSNDPTPPQDDIPPWAKDMMARQDKIEKLLSTVEPRLHRAERSISIFRQQLGGRMQVARLGFLTRMPQGLMQCTFNAWVFATKAVHDERAEHAAQFPLDRRPSVKAPLPEETMSEVIERAIDTKYDSRETFRLTVRAGSCGSKAKQIKARSCKMTEPR